MSRLIPGALLALSLTVGFGLPANAQESPIRIPEPIRIEHEHLHQDLAEAMKAGGRTGDAASQVQQALSGHFEEENRLVMPLLGLLEPLAKGRVTEQMRPAVAMSREVQQKLPRFMEEHRAIHKAVEQLISAAEAEGKSQVADFGRRLALHAQHEEVVLYPAAIVVGERVEAALAAK
ncbi:hypothetical protein F6455_04065 [Proteobacteria bacterium 005FR1]|nr:hypothetical protein [Proteobacteria bacterium 005FR1]